ncbi:MAG: hypothetical protein WCG87_03250 [Bacteroidota bacterium]
MEFEQLVKEHIEPFLKEKGFSLERPYKNSFHFKSDMIQINIGYNNYERSCLFGIGMTGEQEYIFTNKAIKNVFGTEIKLAEVTVEDFVLNVVSFLQNEGSELLNKGSNKFKELEEFLHAESRRYTIKMMQDQYLPLADNAWKNGEYQEFIRVIDELKIEELPDSYKMKYEIANKRK